MNLLQAANKLSQCNLYGYNLSTLIWEKLPFNCLYPTDGRFIGRSVSFYNRRQFITPVDIPPQYPVVRIGLTDSEPLMIYASQENINRNQTYLFSHTGFNIQGYAAVHRLTKDVASSGMGIKNTNVVVGTYPVALEKGFAGPSNPEVRSSHNSRLSCYVPAYADIRLSDTLLFQSETYTIDESIPELKLRWLQLTKK